MYRSQGLKAVWRANTTQIQKKFVKPRVGDEVKHFKLESTYLEQIHRRFSVLKIKSEVQLKISDCQKNLKLRFKKCTVLKPCITVKKPSNLQILA